MARRIRPTGGPLDIRAQSILRAVIEDYVTSATPIGSQALVDHYQFGMSSATVRNVLAELELAGYLTHPHTSAGRIPTDVGYRYYVESLMDLAPLSAVEQLMIRHQFGQIEYANEQWFRLAATTLASATRAAGLATPAKSRASRLRRLDLVAMGERLASLILVLHEGTVKQALVTLDVGTEQTVLSAAAARLNEVLGGLTAAEIERRLGRFGGDDELALLTRRIAARVARAMREFDAAAIQELFSDGLLNVMAAPEFTQSEKLRGVFTALENRVYLGDLVDTVTRAGSLQLFIGRENRPAEMTEVSLVLAPYGRPGRAVGVVGVLGPTRMSYPTAVGTVRFVSGLMNELVDHLYA